MIQNTDNKTTLNYLVRIIKYAIIFKYQRDMFCVELKFFLMILKESEEALLGSNIA
jgi:hypothetical protein